MIEFLWEFLNPVVFLSKAVCVIAFALVCNYQSNKMLTIAVLILLPIFFIGMELIGYGLPHHWSTASLIGKLSIYYFVYLVLFASVLFFSFVLPEKLNKAYKTIISLVVGILFLYIIPGIKLILICFFTGDCL